MLKLNLLIWGIPSPVVLIKLLPELVVLDFELDVEEISFVDSLEELISLSI
jgi:hypothetical protein